MIIICDLDGTLCDHNWRKHHEEAGEYDRYHRLCTEDFPFYQIGILLVELVNVGHKVAFMTARTEKFRGSTEDWLQHRIPMLAPGSYELYMRADDDTRPSAEVKRDMFVQHFLDLNRGVWFVLEDKPSVVEMWKEYGVTVFQVHQESGR